MTTRVIYLTLEQALDKVFARADSTWTESWTPTPEEIADLEMTLGWRVPETEFVFYRGQRKGQDLGVAMVTEEKGRFKPITFIVKVGADGRVENVLLMVYRESRGDGVKRQRFLKQFRKKDVDSGMRLNRDIIGVSGATLSSRALSAGVKRVLATLDVLYGEPVR